MIKSLLFLAVTLIIPYAAFGACHFEKLKISPRDKDTSGSKLDSSTNAVLDGSDEKHHVYEGPLWIEARGQKRCTIDGGIYSGLYYARSKNLIMIREYSGSCGDHKIYNVSDCKQVGQSADYCGSADLKGEELINPPPCESVGHEASCSTGKVFKISPQTCELTLDEDASRKLTKEKLGVELPLDDTSHVVSGARTSAARIEN